MVEWKVSLCSVSFLCFARISSNFMVARFGVLTVVLLKIPVFWGVMLCHWESGSQYFEGSWCLDLQCEAGLPCPEVEGNMNL
jgi:hypothetical protein